jgi:hypothetical protein
VDAADDNRISTLTLSLTGCEGERGLDYAESLLAPLFNEDDRDALHGFIRRPRTERTAEQAEHTDLVQTRTFGTSHLTFVVEAGS